MSKQHDEAVQHSSREPNWRTPPALFAQLDREFQFVLDAAALKTDKLCPHYFGPDHQDPKLRNALTVEWSAHIGGLYQLVGILSRCAIWINPPFSREHKMPIGPWIEKCWKESRAGCTVVGVIPYSPQTEWWRQWVEGHGLELKDFHAARETRKIPHRVSFLRPDGSEADNAGGNTAVVVWKAGHGICAPWVPWAPYFEYF